MAKTKVLFGKELEVLKKGIDIVYQAVSSTLGSSGKNVIMRSYYSNNPVATNDGVTIAKSINLQDEAEAMGADMLKQAAERTNDEAGDGPQPLTSMILTPTGFIKMGNIKIGDEICGTKGSIQKVLGIFPKGKKRIVKVHFEDKREVECCEDHLWSVITNSGKSQTMTTKDLIKQGLFTIEKNGYKKHNFYVPIGIADFKMQKPLPIDPYFLGLLIGDGSLSGSGSIELSLGLAKEHTFDKIVLPEGLRMNTKYVEHKNYFRTKINGKTKDGKSIQDLLKEIGLLGVKSDTKFIPKQYLYSDLVSRNALLQGLSDTDGYINNRGLLEYSTVSKQLFSDVTELLNGLGKVVYTRLHERTNDHSYSNRPIYRISVLVGNKYGNKITEIEITEKEVEMKCIKVSNPDNLYFTDNYILTHNTTTSIVLAHAMIEKGKELVGKGENAIRLMREMNEAVPKIIQELNVKKIETDADLFNVANISMENESVAKIVAEATKKVGENGTVIVEESNGIGITREDIEGIKFDKGYVSPFMATNPETMEAVLKDVLVLVSDKQISMNKDIFGLLEKVNKEGIKQILIIAKSVNGEILSTIIANRLKGTFHAVAVEMPFDSAMLEDIAILTGGDSITEEKYPRELTAAHFQILGKASKIVVTKDSCLVVGGFGKKEKIEERIKSIKAEIKDATPYKKEQLKERLAKLVGGVVVLKVGAPTEAEMKYLKLKVDDAVASCRAALEEGVIIGGGKALYEVSLAKSATKGEEVIRYACSCPIKKIIENAGYEVGPVISNLEIGQVWNASNNQVIKDPFSFGLVDPLKVARCALTNASSLAGQYITASSCIVNVKENTTE